MTSDLNPEGVTPALVASRVRVIGAGVCLVLWCSCATTPDWDADDSIRPPLPGETSLNKGAGRGEHIRVTLHLKSGQEIPVMVDTGSPDTMLDKSLNSKLGKRLGKETYRFPAMKKGTAATYRSPELYLGGTQLRIGKNVSTIDWNGGAAILGMDCLHHYCIQLDFTAGKLRFLDPDHLKTGELGQAFPITISSRTRHVHLREDFMGVKGAKWIIDTGLNVDGVLKRKLFRKAIRAQHVSPVQGELNGAKGLGACFPEAEFRGETYTNLIIGEMPRNTPLPNLIGLQFLARHLVTLNFPKRIMYLKRTSVGPLIDESSSANAVRNVDFSEAPEMNNLAEHARGIGNGVYPKILSLLADDSSKLPRHFDIVFKKHLEGHFGQTVGATINLRAEWFAKNPTDLDETLIHEMSHVAQKYPSKAWDYWGEGIADYVCYKLGYTNEWNWPHCSFEYPHYASGYCCAGAFLMLVDAAYGSNVVRELNAELRRGSYADSFFAKATGKSMDALWTEFQKTPAFTQVAGETLKLQAELGYVNRQPPKDIGRRLTTYLLQQPGGALTLEATEFLAKLVEDDQLPGILKVLGREISWGIGGPNLRKEASSATYPAARTFCGRKTDDPSAYYCVVVRLSKESGWSLQRAWRAGPEGRVMEEYPLP